MDSGSREVPSRQRSSARRLSKGALVGGAVVLAMIVSLASLAVASSTSFPDVSTSHPYYTAISDLASRDIINGKADGNFYPSDPVMRQQFAKMIVKAMGHYVPPGVVCPFNDVDLTPNPVDPLYPAACEDVVRHGHEVAQRLRYRGRDKHPALQSRRHGPHGRRRRGPQHRSRDKRRGRGGIQAVQTPGVVTHVVRRRSGRRTPHSLPHRAPHRGRQARRLGLWTFQGD